MLNKLVWEVQQTGKDVTHHVQRDTDCLSTPGLVMALTGPESRMCLFVCLIVVLFCFFLLNFWFSCTLTKNRFKVCFHSEILVTHDLG